jgi:hypothetical protein
MDRYERSKSETRQLMQDMDRDRREFAKRHFKRNIDDPRLYDLLIRVDRLGLEATVAQIVTAAQRMAERVVREMTSC